MTGSSPGHKRKAAMAFTLSLEKNHSAPDQLHVSREKECDILVYQGHNVDRIRSLMDLLGFPGSGVLDIVRPDLGRAQYD
jgi:hypothetical protein